MVLDDKRLPPAFFDSAPIFEQRTCAAVQKQCSFLIYFIKGNNGYAMPTASTPIFVMSFLTIWSDIT
jgi:hypothetical protein